MTRSAVATILAATATAGLLTLYGGYAGVLPGVNALLFGKVQQQSVSPSAPLAQVAVVARKEAGEEKPAHALGAALDPALRQVPMLHGTAQVGERRLALIAVDRRRAEIFGVGQQVAGDLTLHAVFKDYVVLQGANGSVLIRTGDVEPEVRTGASYPPPPRAAVGTPHVAYALSRSDVRSQLNPENAGRFAKLVPAPTEGVRIVELQESSVFSRLGMRPGDIVRSVNGTRLHGVEDLATALNAAGARESARLELVRGRAVEHWHIGVTDR